MKNYLIKQKIALSLIIISIISLVVVGLIVFIFIQQTLLSNKKVEISSGITEQAHESILTFKNNQLFTHMLATRTRVQEFLQSRTDSRMVELNKIFLEYTTKDNKYLVIYLLDKNGVGLISTDPRFVGQDYSFRDYFKKAINGEANVDIAIGKTSNQFGYYFSEPVYDSNNSILGVMVVKIDEKDISTPITTSELTKNNILMLVDEFGVIVSSSNSDRIFKSLGVLTDIDKNKIKNSDRFLGKEISPLQYDSVELGVLQYKNPTTIDFFDKIDNENEIVTINKLDDLPFYLISEVRLGVLNQQVFSSVLAIVSIVTIILLIIYFSIYYLLTVFLSPLGKFKLFFSKISAGNFSDDIDIKTNDEFSDLALSVNKMSRDLSSLYQNLDEKVKEQTLKINKKVTESEDQNRAILNILEDVEKEKSNAEKLADDLEKFKLAVENVSDQIVITDKEGIVIYGNKAVEKITGYTPEEAMGKKAGALWKMPMPLEYYQNLWDVIKTQKKTFIGEIQNKRKFGDVYTAMISIASVLNKDGDIIYFVAIERDITKEKEVDKAKTEFVSLASHQLRTPLSAINWYTEMLLAGDAGAINEEQKKYLDEIALGNKRMVNLVDDLLNVSRLDMGTFVVGIGKVNVQEMIKSVLGEMKPQILRSDLKVAESYGDDIQEFQADEKLLRMVFQNLISNAVKYTTTGGFVKINLLKLKKDDDFGGKKLDGDSLVFSVEDSGIGIPISQQDRIFSKLFRADNAKESETEGTGLGLYVVKSIIEQSGGLVWFKSEENKGSTFYVVFPISGMKTKDKLK